MTHAFRYLSVLILTLGLVLPVHAQSAGLPDFTGLVERSAGAVVNITARKTGGGDDDIAQL